MSDIKLDEQMSGPQPDSLETRVREQLGVLKLAQQRIKGTGGRLLENGGLTDDIRSYGDDKEYLSEIKTVTRFTQAMDGAVLNDAEILNVLDRYEAQKLKDKEREGK